MGNRANFVIVENSDWQLYYSHWAGCRMLDALIGGPDHALRYVQSLRGCPKDEWVDPLWADGGAVLDLDRRRLLFFGDELMVQMNERRAVMTVLATLWPDYSIGWAYDGTVELAGYVGAEVRPYVWETRPALQLAENRSELSQVVSVLDGDGRLRLWPLRWHRSKVWHGAGLLDVLPGRGVKGLTLGKLPDGGVHIDVPRKAVGVWQIADTMGIFHALSDIWDGWQTACWEDRFEEQVRRCQGALRVPQVDLVAGVEGAAAWIGRRVFQSFAESLAGQIAKLTGMLSSLEPGLAVSDDAGKEGGVRPTAAEWARFVAACDFMGGRTAESA